MSRLSSTMLWLTLWFCVLVAVPTAIAVTDGCSNGGEAVYSGIDAMCGGGGGSGENIQDTGSLISVDVGILHMKTGIAPESDGGETTVVEGGFRTGIWNESMTVQDTINPDGSRDVTTTHKRTIGGVVTRTTEERERIPSP